MAISHVYSQTVADGTATSVVRPSDWNSAHNQYMTIGSNTAGASTLSGTNIQFNGGNNLTLSANGNTLIFSAANQSVQTQNLVSINGSTGNMSLNVGSSLSASTNGSSITFGLASNITTALQSAGAYLTTAAQSNHSHNFATTTTNGALVVVGTTNSAGATIGVPPFITTAMASNAATISNINVSAGTTSNNLSALTFNNGNGVTFGLNAGTITASVAAAGGAQTGISGVIASNATFTSGTISFADGNGVSFGTAANQAISLTHGLQYTSATSAITSNALHSSASKVAGIVANTNNAGGGTATLTGNVSFSNANGLSFYTSAGNAVVGSYTVPTQTVQPAIQSIIVSNTTYTTGAVSFSNANGLTFGSSAGGAITGSHNGLTTAAQSNHSHNLATTTTNGSLIVVATTNSAGATVAVPPYITTYAAQTNQTANFYVSGNSTQLSSTAGLDLRSISFEGAGIASVGVSNGRVLVSVPSGGGAGDGYNIVYAGTTGTTGTTWSSASASVRINGGNNITVSQNGSNDIVISAAQGGIAAGSQTATSGTLVFANSNGVTFGMSGSSQITASVNAGGGGYTKTFWYPYNEAVNVMGQQGQATFVINPLPLDDELNADRIVFPMYFSNASNTTGTLTVSFWIGMYTKNGSTLSSYGSTSFSSSLAYAGNNSSASNNGIRLLTCPWTTTLPQSRYYVGVGMRSTTGGANATLSQVLVSQLNSNLSGMWGVATNRSIQWPIGVGYYSASTTGVPATIGISQIDGTNSLAARPPSWHMISGTA